MFTLMHVSWPTHNPPSPPLSYSHSFHDPRQDKVPEDEQTRVSIQHYSTCHPLFSRTANPDPECFLGISSLTQNCFVHPHYLSVWCRVDTDRGAEREARVEVKWARKGGRETSLIWNGEEADGGEGFSEWDSEMCVSHLKELAELLLPRIHGNRLRTNSSPCWGLLFLQRKWLKAVKVRKPRTQDDTSHADTYPLSATRLKIPPTANIKGQFLTI